VTWAGGVCTVPPTPPSVYIYMGPEGIFPAQNATGQTGGGRGGEGRPYHHYMDRKEGGDIYGAPNWLGVGVALAAVAIIVVALVLELLD
jgi:hypothetical protein